MLVLKGNMDNREEDTASWWRSSRADHICWSHLSLFADRLWTDHPHCHCWRHLMISGHSLLTGVETGESVAPKTWCQSSQLTFKFLACHCIIMSGMSTCQSHSNYYLETFDNNSNDKQMTSVLFLVSKCSQFWQIKFYLANSFTRFTVASWAWHRSRPCALVQQWQTVSYQGVSVVIGCSPQLRWWNWNDM